MNDLFLRACRREPVERTPVWMMRQAGRYLPQYRAVRERADFLTMVGTPELAVEVTLQPVDLLGVDAAIIFSDILVVPQAMGMALSVEEGTGPRFHSPLRSPADFDRLRDPDPEQDLGYVLGALRLARRSLEGRVPLIGFAGAPWTLM
ncbi:MAG TPA: uroporphyrinogen decarboxylase family protein, partial [Gemmatimonadales bacterium]